MSARMEKVREALARCVPATSGLLAPALAEAEEWEDIRDGLERLLQRRMDEMQRIEHRAEAAEAERDAAYNMCGTCRAYSGTTSGCEECSEFMEESGHNARRHEQSEAAEADLNETRSLLLKATDDRRLKAVEAEADRLKAALERIYQSGRGRHVEIARDALNV